VAFCEALAKKETINYSLLLIIHKIARGVPSPSAHRYTQVYKYLYLQWFFVGWVERSETHRMSQNGG
jgi:hypothetical protein